MNGNPHDAERQRQQPNDGIKHQSEQRNWPTKDEQDNPQKESSHGNLIFGNRMAAITNDDSRAAGLHSTLRKNARRSSLHRIRLETEALGDRRGHFRIEPHMRIVNFRVKDAP